MPHPTLSSSPCSVLPLETLSQGSYSYGLSTAASGYENKQYRPPAAGPPPLPATASLCPSGRWVSEGQGGSKGALLTWEEPQLSHISDTSVHRRCGNSVGLRAGLSGAGRSFWRKFSQDGKR